MLKQVDLKDILEKNPHLNKEDLARNQDLAEELRKLGTQPRGYRLAPPFERKRVPVGKGDYDPRTIDLAASRH